MVEETPSGKPQRTTIILAVAICALLVRAAFVAASADGLNADPDAYRRIAENLRQTGVYGTSSSPTAFRPPLYPILLALTAVNGEVTAFSVGVLHILFGTGTVVLTFLLARHWQLGRWSFAAAGLVAVDPILLHQSTLVMTETLATFLAAAALFVLSWWDARPSFGRAVLAGIVFGLACLCRPTFLPWLGLAALAMVLQGFTKASSEQWLGSSLRDPGNAATSGSKPHPQSGGATSKLGSQSAHCNVIIWPIALVLSAALVLSPWIVRNYYVFGVPKATTTHGGYTVLLGNNPSFYRYLREAPRGTTWDSTELADAWALRRFSTSPHDTMWSLPHRPDDVPATAPIDRTEFEDDQFAYSLAWRYIGEQPGMFAYSCLVRVSRLWQGVPYRTGADESWRRALLRVLTGAWYSVILVLAIAALIERRTAIVRPPLVWGLLLCLTFTAVHSLYWSNMRMRAPLMPFVCLLAAAGAASLLRRVARRKP